MDLLKETAKVSFDASAEAHIRLGVDPRHADQMVRGTVVLPHGMGKTVRVVVFAQGEKAQEALRAGADEVGGEDLVKRIEAGWLEFDVALATPDMMGMVGKLGRILGRRGLMPNPKSGTITFDLERAISEVKAGRVEFKVDKAGIIHVPFGKAQLRAPAAGREPGRADRRDQPRQAERREGAVFQEPDGGIHHGPRHPRGCPGGPGAGSGLGSETARASSPAPRPMNVPPQTALRPKRTHGRHAAAVHQRSAARRTGPKSSTGPGTRRGTPTGTPRQGHYERDRPAAARDALRR